MVKIYKKIIMIKYLLVQMMNYLRDLLKIIILLGLIKIKIREKVKRKSMMKLFKIVNKEKLINKN